MQQDSKVWDHFPIRCMLQHVTLKSPKSLSLYVFTLTCLHREANPVKKGEHLALWPGQQSHCLPCPPQPITSAPSPIHFCTHISATAERISLKWPGVCYVLSVSNTDKQKVQGERTTGPTGICDIMTGGGKASKDTITYMVIEIIIIIPGNVS